MNQEGGVPLDRVLERVQGKLGEAMTAIAAQEVLLDMEIERRLAAEQTSAMLEAKLKEMEENG